MGVAESVAAVAPFKVANVRVRIQVQRMYGFAFGFRRRPQQG